ncbi:DMBT1-like protein, partial [Mya arenaria]
DFGDLDIRLADGNGVLDGRVERQINGVWGTVCNSNFDIKDAQVICRMLSSNLTALQVIKDGRYGQGQGPIFYDRLRCSGTELSIDDCYSITGEQCLHNQDVAIVCSACPSSEDFYFGEFQNISVVNNVQVYHGLCGNGTSEYEFAYICATDGVWYPRNNSCRHLDITDIRFTDGLGLYDGIVEVLVGDTWGSTCDNEYTLARVVCNAIGATVRSYGPKYSTTPPFLDGLICERFDSGINNCSYNTFASCTYKNYVACEVRPLNITNIRLADGPGENAGKVELFVDGHWGKVCENSFDINDAKVLCSMLGARTTAYLLGNFYGNGSGPALLNYLGCRGTENTTNECSYGAPYYYRGYYWSYYTYTHDCYQSDSVSLICTDCGLISTTDGQIKSFDNTAMELTVLCNPGYTVSYTLQESDIKSWQWTPNFLQLSHIEINSCPDLKSPNGNIHSFNTTTMTATLWCYAGIYMENTCLSNGSWTSDENC